MSEFRDRLIRFYEQYASDKLDKVDELLAKSKGKEEQLFAKLVDKYGPEPEVGNSTSAKPEKKEKQKKESKAKQRTRQAQQQQQEEEGEEEEEVDPSTAEEPSSNSAPPAASATSAKAEYGTRGWWKERLMRFYAKYAPEKKEKDVEGLLDKAKDNPTKLMKLFEMLEQKYGPEPDPSSDEEDDDDEEEDASSSKKAAAEEEEEEEEVEIPGLRKIVYCPVDGIPPEYSEYFETFQQALPWIAGHYPELVLATQKGVTSLEHCQKLGLEPIADNIKVAKADKAQARKRGGAKKGDGKILIESIERRKKSITYLKGLEHVEGVKLKDAAKQLGKKFASGASVKTSNSGEDMIEIQGDWSYDLPEVLVKFFPNIDKKSIYTIDEDGKKEKAFD